MAFSSGNRKSESGAQLLARLSSRPDLKGVDPFIFAKTSSSSQFIELYGTEGCGKSELALDCVAKVCLSSSGHGVCLGGLQGKVIFIDTDSKFSILRLAVILERHIHRVLNSLSKAEFEEWNSKSSPDIFHGNQDSKKEEINETSKSHPSGINKYQPSSDSERKEAFHIDKESNPNMIVQNDRSVCSRQNLHSVNTTNVPLSMSSSSQSQKLTPEEIEEIVQDSLSRIQVLRVFNSQQLLASLLSLESMFLEDSLYSLLVIDSISAFFWLDRIASPTSYHHLDSRMVSIAKTLKKYASEFGMTNLITKSAYFQGKKTDRDYTVSDTESHVTNYERMYNEYLGKIWSSLNVKRIFLTSILREENSSDKNIDAAIKMKTISVVKMIQAHCMASQTDKCYLFQDDILVSTN